MGSIYSRKNDKGETWYIQYRHNGQHIREKVGCSWKGFTKKQAQDALKSREGDIVHGKFNIAQTKKYPTFNNLLDKYLVWSETHKQSYKRDLTSAKHLKPFWGNKRINEITSFMVEQYKKSRKDEIKAMLKNKSKDERDVSFGSINRELALLKHMFSMAMRWGDIDHNVIKGLKMFPEKTRGRYLSESEIDALLDACETSKNRHLKVIVMTALTTGGRLMEILRLKVTDLDFKNSLIYFEHTKNGDIGKVPMGDELREALLKHIQNHKHEFLFCRDDGTPFNEIRDSFKNALKAAGIKSFRFHDLRHTFASHLAMNGIEGRTLQELGRWKTPSMTMRYAHLSAQHKKTAIDTLGKLFQKNDNAKNRIADLAIL